MSVKGIIQTLMLVTVILLGLLASSTVAYAEELKGRFAEYTFSLERSDSDMSKTIDGAVRIEVVSDYGNGTVRVKYEGYIRETAFTIERNTDSSYIFPYIPELPEVFIPYRNLTVAVRDKGVESVLINGEDHLVNVTEVALAGTILHKDISLNVDIVGQIRTFKSSLLYSLTGQGRTDSSRSDARLSISIQIRSTNLDVDSEPPRSIKIQIPLEFSRFYSPPSGGNEVAESSSGDPYILTLVVIPAVAVGLLGSVLYLRRRNGERPAQEAGEKPLHWVY